MARALRDARYNDSPKGRARRVRDEARRAERNARRVWVGRYYVGVAPTPEHAESLNNEAREEFHDRKNTSAA